MAVESGVHLRNAVHLPAMLIEIHAAEGGDDAKDLVREQAAIYLKLASRHGL